MSPFLKSMKKFGEGIGDVVSDIGDLEWSDVLGAVGLQKRRSAIEIVLPAIGLLVVGGAIGAGIGLLFAPSSGRRMRQNVEDRIATLRDRFKNNEGANNAVPKSVSTHGMP